MSTRYEQQIEKLVAYVRKLNQTVEERNQQLHYWQGYARKLRDERQRLGQSMLGQVRRVLADVAARYRDASTEVSRLRQYVESLRALHQRRELVEDRENLPRYVGVVTDARWHADRIRTATQRLAHGHGRMHAEPAHFVGAAAYLEHLHANWENTLRMIKGGMNRIVDEPSEDEDA